MKSSVKSATAIPYGVLSAMVVTAALFLTLPLLTQLHPTPSGEGGIEPVFISPHKPVPPPSEARDEPEKQSIIEKEFEGKDVRPQRVQPSFDIPKAGIFGGDAGGIQIAVRTKLDTISPIPEPTYRPEEVDQRPALLRSFPPQFPYLASRDNIEGWVTVRLVVDVDGNPQKVEVVASEPRGIFEEAALKAVERFKFKPAIKNGAAVSCIIQQRIRFNLD